MLLSTIFQRLFTSFRLSNGQFSSLLHIEKNIYRFNRLFSRFFLYITLFYNITICIPQVGGISPGRFQPCERTNKLENRTLHIVTCDNFGKRPHFRSTDAIDTWNITSMNLWQYGVSMTNVCSGKSWEYGFLTKTVSYQQYVYDLMIEVGRRDQNDVGLLYVMLMDSDTFWSVDNIDDIWNRFDCVRGEKEIVISSEMGCWLGYHCNQTEIDTYYHDISQTPSYSAFINSGVIMGKASFIHDMLSTILSNNQSYFTYDHRRKEDRYHDQHASGDYTLRIAPQIVAIDYHQQLVGGFSIHISEGKPSLSLSGNMISKIVCRARNGSIDYHCKDLTQVLRFRDPRYFRIDDVSCKLTRQLRMNMPGYHQLESLASQPIIWHGNGQGKRSYVMYSRLIVDCMKLKLNGTSSSLSSPMMISKKRNNDADNFTRYAKCPCVSTPRSNKETHPTHDIHKICFVNNSITHDFLSIYATHLHSYGHDIMIVNNSSYDKDIMTCRGVIELITPQPILSKCSYKYICPESCLPKPYTIMPSNWLVDAMIYDNTSYAHIPVTCSLTVGHIAASISSSTSKPSNHRIAHIIDMIITRRVQECVEREYWLRPSNATYGKTNLYLDDQDIIVPRRQVFGLIIWIGSLSRLDMSIAQIQSLQSQYMIPADDMIAGWIASEEQYSCRIGSGSCRPMISNHSHLLKDSEVNQESFGWQCAQRRPLRALAHILSLYDPEFIYIVDDDTFVNMKFLTPSSSLSYYIRHYLSSYPDVVGYLELPHGGGKITKQGIFYGGRGYLMGKAVINRLQSHVISGPHHIEDRHRSKDQMKYLSILRAAYDGLSSCPATTSFQPLCLQFSSSTSSSWLSYDAIYNITAISAIRLVDLCVNLMAKERTCYHSDHAMTRCLAHGAYTNHIRIDCPASQSKKDHNFSYAIGRMNHQEYTELGSCYYKFCDMNHSLTCHRYVYNRPDMTGMKRAMKMHVNDTSSSSMTSSTSSPYDLLRQEWCQ